MERYTTTDWMFMLFGFALALFITSLGMWTKKGRVNERRANHYRVPRYLYATLFFFPLGWAAYNLRTGDFIPTHTVSTYLLMVGYLLVYPLIFLKSFLLKKMMRSKAAS